MTATDASLPTAVELGLVEFVHRDVVTSTMDEAHARAAAGARGGTLILAVAQSEGRGRGGKTWQSAAGDGVWFTLIECPRDASGLPVLSLRLGLMLARALAPLTDGEIRLKWPNDLYVEGGKLAGILVEARWRQGMLDWVAVGVGINMRVIDTDTAVAALRRGTTRGDVLRRVIPAMRTACAAVGVLTSEERTGWDASDLARGREVREPVAGIVRGIGEDGALLVETKPGEVMAMRSGSLVFAAPQATEPTTAPTTVPTTENATLHAEDAC